MAVAMRGLKALKILKIKCILISINTLTYVENQSNQIEFFVNFQINR